MIVADVYPAGEAPIDGIDRDALRARACAATATAGRAAAEPRRWRGVVARACAHRATVVCLGAGNITSWAYALPGELEALG